MNEALKKLVNREQIAPYSITDLENVILLGSKWLTPDVCENAAQDLAAKDAEIARLRQIEAALREAVKDILIFHPELGIYSVVSDYNKIKKLAALLDLKP